MSILSLTQIWVLGQECSEHCRKGVSQMDPTPFLMESNSCWGDRELTGWRKWNGKRTWSPKQGFRKKKSHAVSDEEWLQFSMGEVLSQERKTSAWCLGEAGWCPKEEQDWGKRWGRRDRGRPGHRTSGAWGGLLFFLGVTRGLWRVLDEEAQVWRLYWE